MKTIYERVSEIVISLGVAEQHISPEANLSTDLGMDSLDRAELITLCEQEFEIDIADADLHQLATVEDIVEYIHAKIMGSGEQKGKSKEVILSKIASFVGIRRFRKLN
jgi:acyl carrier protein